MQSIAVDVCEILCEATIVPDRLTGRRIGMIKPHPIDVHVGKRLRLLRLSAGMSQTQLAEAVGVTFQQVQKYEKGSNRISASRLFELASILGVDISFFFKDATPPGDGGPGLFKPIDFEFGQVDLDLVRQLAGIEDTDVKRKLLALVDGLSASKVDAEEDANP